MGLWPLRVLAPVRIVAADVDDKKLQQTRALGADDIVNNRNASEAAERIQQITGPRGAGLVLDCVGVQPTLDLGAKLLGRNSVWTIVGLGGGRHEFRHGSTPYGTSMSIPYWGSRVELMEVIAMARNGRIHVETTEFPLSEAVEVYARLKAGQITGRAVLIVSRDVAWHTRAARSAFQRVAIPSRALGRRFVGALEEREQRRVGVRRRADGVIG